MPASLLKMALAMLTMSAFTPVLAFAQESESKIKIEDETEKNKAPGEDVDELITNKQMRAQSGSKSKYSIATSLTYSGGTVQTPLAEQRPNIVGAATSTDVSGLVGDISGKYNFDQRHSLLAGVGVRYVTPFYGTATPKTRDTKGNLIYDGDKVDADNPYVTGQYIYKSGAIQNVLTLQGLAWTASDKQAANYVSQWNLQQISAYELGNTGLTLALAALLSANTFSVYDGGQNDLMINIDPYVEYRLNDTFNLRTVFNLWNYDHFKSDSMMTWGHEGIAQSVGLGISVTRDIFLYPNVQFILDDIRADRTNVALSSFINIF